MILNVNGNVVWVQKCGEENAWWIGFVNFGWGRGRES